MDPLFSREFRKAFKKILCRSVTSNHPFVLEYVAQPSSKDNMPFYSLQNIKMVIYDQTFMPFYGDQKTNNFNLN